MRNKLSVLLKTEHLRQFLHLKDVKIVVPCIHINKEKSAVVIQFCLLGRVLGLDPDPEYERSKPDNFIPNPQHYRFPRNLSLHEKQVVSC